MATLSASDFVALARSSPWRWRSVRFTATWCHRVRREPVRAWVRRPGCLRVETPTGDLLASGCRACDEPPADPGGAAPVLDQAGLVVERPWPWRQRDEDPMYLDYRWVAMLDPGEFADGDGGPTPVEVTELRPVDHYGRTAWEAMLHTTASYDPRCSCCPLLFGVDSERREAEAGGTRRRDREPGLRYPDAHRVRLDVATAVCVLTEEVGGSWPGTGHELRIEAVDEPMPDELFQPPPSKRWWRRSR